MGLPTLLRGEFRPGSRGAGGRQRSHCSSPNSSGRSSTRRQAQPNSVYSELQGFLWGSWPRTRSPDGYFTFSGCRLLCLRRSSRTQWLLRTRFLVHECHIEYAKQARDGGKLSLPALFLHATYDFICETTANSRFADPMRKACSNLTEVYIKSGHWMAQEQPVAVNRALARFIAEKLPKLLSSALPGTTHEQGNSRRH